MDTWEEEMKEWNEIIYMNGRNEIKGREEKEEIDQIM